jgi:hypothetical protein
MRRSWLVRTILSRASLCALGLAGPLGLVVPAATAEFPRFSAGMGYGIAGLYHSEYVAQALHSSDVGGFSAGSWSADVGYLFASHFMIGARIHGLRVRVADGAPVGRLDILPATAYLAYRRPALAGHFGGYLGMGLGGASVRFAPADSIDAWIPWGGERIEVSDERPFAAEVFAGAEVRIAEDLSLELTGSSTWLDSEIAFRPRPIEEEEGGFAPGHAYRIKARHVALALGLRWWVEWW